MSSIPYHTMSVYTWLVPGGNRDEKKNLSLNKTFPMRSAIRRNLGGALSEVFFTNLSSVSKDQIGYTPKLSGPGIDLWVSPSDLLINKVKTQPPFTNRLNLARTHHWIMEVGGRYLKQIYAIFTKELEEALAEKEQVMREEANLAIDLAIRNNRKIMSEINKEDTMHIVNNLKESFLNIIADIMAKMSEEFNERLTDELKAKEDAMIKQLYGAVKEREKFLHLQYEFRLEWQANKCYEQYQNSLKQSQKEWLKLLDEAEEKFEYDLAKMKATLESEHFNALLELQHRHMWERQTEKKEMQFIFKNWYVNEFKKELLSRDFAIIDLEKSLVMKTNEIDKKASKIQDLYRQFQKFINFALKAKPGEAEFLLSLELLMKTDWKEICEDSHSTQEELSRESQLIAQSILEHMLKTIFTQKELEDILFGPKQPKTLTENFVQEIEMERIANRALKVVGESKSRAGSEEEFKKRHLESMKMIFERHPSLFQFFQDEHNLPPSVISLTSQNSI